MVNTSLFRDAKIWVHGDLVILTDPPDSKRIDAVFPHLLESDDLCARLKIKENDSVLDLCTGSGIIAIKAAQKAHSVVAVDINPRALEFAQLNAQLNCKSSDIEFLLGNLFEPVKGRKFDLITTNPPFEPVPSNCNYFVHSNGGIDGLRLIEMICEEVHDYLNSNGIFQMLLFSANPYDENWFHALSSHCAIDIEWISALKMDAFRLYLETEIKLLNPGQEISLRLPELFHKLVVTARRD